MVHLLYPVHCPKCLIFTIFLKFSQQLYKVDTVIGPSIIEETMESLNYKYVSWLLLGLVFLMPTHYAINLMSNGT